MPTADEYVREISLAIAERYEGDCVTHACRIAELLLAEGRSPWIGRLRDHVVRPDGTFIGPLTPKRYRGRASVTWTTHYVAATGDEVYDPLVGTPIDVTSFGFVAFGRELTVEVHLDPETTERLIAAGDLRKSLYPARMSR